VLRCGEMGRAEMSPAHRSACASIHLPPRCLRHQGEVSTWHTAEALLLARLLCLQMLHIGIHHVRGPFVRFTCARSARPPHGLGKWRKIRPQEGEMGTELTEISNTVDDVFCESHQKNQAEKTPNQLQRMPNAAFRASNMPSAAPHRVHSVHSQDCTSHRASSEGIQGTGQP
jgi:hypothetical protein